MRMSIRRTISVPLAGWLLITIFVSGLPVVPLMLEAHGAIHVGLAGLAIPFIGAMYGLMRGILVGVPQQWLALRGATMSVPGSKWLWSTILCSSASGFLVGLIALPVMLLFGVGRGDSLAWLVGGAVLTALDRGIVATLQLRTLALTKDYARAWVAVSLFSGMVGGLSYWFVYSWLAGPLFLPWQSHTEPWPGWGFFAVCSIVSWGLSGAVEAASVSTILPRILMGQPLWSYK